LVALALQDCVHFVFPEAGHCELIGLVQASHCKLDLVEETQGGAALFLHNLVHKFTVKLDFKLAERRFNNVEVVDFCFFAFPKVTV